MWWSPDEDVSLLGYRRIGWSTKLKFVIFVQYGLLWSIQEFFFFLCFCPLLIGPRLLYQVYDIFYIHIVSTLVVPPKKKKKGYSSCLFILKGWGSEPFFFMEGWKKWRKLQRQMWNNNIFLFLVAAKWGVSSRDGNMIPFFSFF